MTLRLARVCCLAAGLALGGVGSTAAQEAVPDRGGRVFGTVGGSFGDGGATVTTSGGAGIRVSRHLGLDVEVLYVPSLEPVDGGFRIQRPFGAIFAPPLEIDLDGSLVAFLTRVVLEFPVAGGRLFPYVTGGGGIGHLTARVRFRAGGDGPIPIPFPLPLEGLGLGDLRPSIFPPPDIERSETGLGLTVAGGLDVRLWRGLAIGADIRWLRLLVDRYDLDVAQVAARVSYRF